MAITYKWDIPAMKAHIQAEGEDNVIYSVYYSYTGSEESGGATYSDTFSGAENFNYVAGTPFTPYENTEAFEAVVIGWLESTLDIAEIQASIAKNIASKITPVNEDLYFTWQNPTPPPSVNDAE